MWDWDKLEQREFDRAVELLLFLKFAHARVTPLDGRGGDGGIDVLIEEASGRRIIVQLKYFPEGFSGKHSDRRRQIQRSLASARKHEPDEWVLVWPSVPHKSDNAFLADLRTANDGLTITGWGRTKLDALLVEFPDVINVMRRTDAAVELLTVWSAESAALIGGAADVDDRVAALKAVVDSGDDHWTWDFATQGSTIIKTLVPKHPNAAQVSPVSVAFTAALGDAHNELWTSLRRSLDFGLSGEHTLPADTVKSFRIDGPPLVRHEPTDGVEVTWHVPVNTRVAGATIKLVLSDANGTHVGTHTGTAMDGGSGAVGASLQVRFANTVTLTYLMPPQEAGKCRMNLEYDTAAAAGDPSLVRRATKLVLDLQVSSQMDVTFNGNRFFQTQAAGTFSRTDDDDWLEKVADLHQLADDLEVIARGAATDLTIPESMSTSDRIWLRCIRLMLEGNVVMSPGLTGLNLTLDDAADRGVQQLLDQPAGQLLLTQEPWHPEIAGLDLHLPDARLWHPNIGVTDREDVSARLRAGQEVPTVLAALDGTSFRLDMPQRLPTPDAPLIQLRPVPWGLRDVAERLPRDS